MRCVFPLTLRRVDAGASGQKILLCLFGAGSAQRQWTCAVRGLEASPSAFGGGGTDP